MPFFTPSDGVNHRDYVGESGICWSRRTTLRSLLGASTVWVAPQLFAQTQGWSAGGQGLGRLVVVFLRGAYDGLSAFVPHGDRHYYDLRPNIAIAQPDGTDQTTLAVDRMFGLHPALAPLMPLWKQGVLAVVPAAGSPDPTRSHFDAQYHWETGAPGQRSGHSGWLNTLAGVRMPDARNRNDKGTTRSQAVAIGIGEANPQILAGSAPVQLIPKGQAAVRQGALGKARTRDAVMDLYAGQDDLSRSFRDGASSRMQTAETLASAMADSDAAELSTPKMVAANNGAGSAKGLLLDVQHLTTLMRQNRRLQLGFLSAGGWDTHANQGNAKGLLANNLSNLATALAQLRLAFSESNDMVVVCSEFGRTAKENGTRGTDHGHGNTMWLMGNQVNGGRWHGRWDGLATGQLHEGRDLPVHHDFRAVLAQVLRVNQGLSSDQVARVFPGMTWDASLSTMMRTA